MGVGEYTAGAKGLPDQCWLHSGSSESRVQTGTEWDTQDQAGYVQAERSHHHSLQVCRVWVVSSVAMWGLEWFICGFKAQAVDFGWW